MSNTKKFRGQDQIVPGSPVGEPIVIDRFAYESCDLKYHGVAKVGSEEIDCKWHIQCYERDTAGQLTSIKTAINKLTTKASEVTVDTTSNPGFVRIEISGGTFFPGFVDENDRVTLVTPTQTLRNKVISDILSDTEILIQGTATDETSTSISDEDLIIQLEKDSTKDFHRRRWDLRENYLYE